MDIIVGRIDWLDVEDIVLFVNMIDFSISS